MPKISKDCSVLRRKSILLSLEVIQKHKLISSLKQIETIYDKVFHMYTFERDDKEDIHLYFIS